jgi:SAM-dependent methyltransferase
VVLDLGCGTGQVTFPVARHVRAVVGVDVEPDMLVRARTEAAKLDLGNVSWLLGADTDVPAIGRALGQVGAVTIGRAVHWMDHEKLFAALRPITRGVAVLNNGVPTWLHPTPWSQALRGFLEGWLDMELTFACGTDQESRQMYREALERAGFETVDAEATHTDTLDMDQLTGTVYSVMSADQLPPKEERPDFERRLADAVQPYAPFVEQVAVTTLFGV